MNAFQFIFQYIKRHKVQYTLGIITLFVVDFANIFIPKLTGVITEDSPPTALTGAESD